MRAATNAALVGAVSQFNAHWNAADATLQDWFAVAELMADAMELHMEDVASAGGGHFDGAYYNPARDDDRLRLQLTRVFNFMCDGQWHTLAEISRATGDPLPSVDAQLRHLRKRRHGSWIVDTVHRGGGLFVRRMRNPNGTTLPPAIPEAYQPPPRASR